jgi:hypothetical protein
MKLGKHSDKEDTEMNQLQREDNSIDSPQDGGKYNKKKKDVVGPDGNLYYGIVAPQYITLNGVKTKNRQARAAVWRGDYYRTKSGLTIDDLSKDPRGKIVSKKKQKMMKKDNAWKKYFGKKMASTYKKKTPEKTPPKKRKTKKRRRRRKSKKN